MVNRLTYGPEATTMRDIDKGLMVGMLLGVSAACSVIGLYNRLDDKSVGLVELVCNDGKEITTPLAGWDTTISATAFGNGVLWSVPTDSGIAMVHWQDQYSACVVRNSDDYQK